MTNANRLEISWSLSFVLEESLTLSSHHAMRFCRARWARLVVALCSRERTRRGGMVERSESGSSRNVEEGKAERSVRIKNKQESKDVHSAFL